jgi:hypothetical protein
VVQTVALANFDPQFARGASNNSRSMSNDGGKYFLVDVLLDMKGERLFSGLTADVDIETKRYDDIIKVPSQAVLGRAPDSLPADIRKKPEVDVTKATVPVVYRYVNGEAVATPVTIGASDLTHTVIKSGLNAHDLVIAGPYKVLESLAHGQKVKNESDATSKPATTTTTTSTSPATTQVSLRTGS